MNSNDIEKIRHQDKMIKIFRNVFILKMNDYAKMWSSFEVPLFLLAPFMPFILTFNLKITH